MIEANNRANSSMLSRPPPKYFKQLLVLDFLDDNEIINESFAFFIAGFETSSSTLNFALLELAQNPQIQDKLRKEIRATLEKHGNQITYDSIQEMEYLDQVILGITKPNIRI